MSKAERAFRFVGLPDDIARIWGYFTFGAGVFVAGAAWGLEFMMSLPWYAQGLVSTGAFLVVLAISVAGVRSIARRIGARRLRREPSSPGSIEFYENRPALSKTRGTLDDELRGMKNAMVGWTVFSQAPHVEETLLQNIRRMVLRHPDSSDLEELAYLQDTRIDLLQASIRDATARAQRQGVDVRWCTGRTLDVTIHNPAGDDAYVRVETYLPRMHVRERPSFVVYKRAYGRLFQSIVGAYEQMWEESMTPESDTQDSQPV